MAWIILLHIAGEGKDNGKNKERAMERIWKGYGKDIERIWKGYRKDNGKDMERIWKGYGKNMERI